MTSKRCETCEQKRFVLGLGGMRKECHACKGTGFVTEAVVKLDKRTTEYKMLVREGV